MCLITYYWGRLLRGMYAGAGLEIYFLIGQKFGGGKWKSTEIKKSFLSRESFFYLYSPLVNCTQKSLLFQFILNEFGFWWTLFSKFCMCSSAQISIKHRTSAEVQVRPLPAILLLGFCNKRPRFICVFTFCNWVGLCSQCNQTALGFVCIRSETACDRLFSDYCFHNRPNKPH